MNASHKLDPFLYLLLPCFFQIKIYIQCKNLIELKEKEIIVSKRIKFLFKISLGNWSLAESLLKSTIILNKTEGAHGQMNSRVFVQFEDVTRISPSMEFELDGKENPKNIYMQQCRLETEW